jgi:hypothetical protein
MEADKRAVIVGINKYLDTDIPNLEGAVNDAKEIRQRLVDCGRFKIEDKHFLIDSNATCEAIRQAISDVLWQTDSHDIALFYFSGHGFVDSYNNGYIAPHNMLKNEPMVNGINMLELKRILLDSVDSTALLILDCCHSGIPAKGEKAIPAVVVAPYDSYFINLDKEEGGKGKFIIASSEADQKAREVSEFRHSQHGPEEGQQHPHGAFTFSLIEGIDGEASDEAGMVSLADLFEKAKQRLKKMGKQEPKVFTADSSGMKAINIAITSKKHNEYIESNLRNVKRFFENRDIASLIRAATVLDKVLQANPQNVEGLEYRNKISRIFTDFMEAARDWLPQHHAEVSPEIPNAYRTMERMVDMLTFDKIVSFDYDKKNLTILLCRISKPTEDEEMDIPRFIRSCRWYENQQVRAPVQKRITSLSP